jgi:hypothetical protein
VVEQLAIWQGRCNGVIANLAWGCGMSHEKGDWRKLCEAASVESDPEKLLELARQIIAALDGERPKTASKQEEKGQIALDSPPKFSLG